MTEISLDAYLVRSCPLKSIYPYHPGFQSQSQPNIPAKFAQDLALLEAEIFAKLLALPEAVDLADYAPNEALVLLRQGVNIAIQAPLEGKNRHGIIDILVRVSDADKPKYLPVEIKYRNIVFATPEHGEVLVSPLQNPLQRELREGWSVKWVKRVPDLVHLAHDWLLLSELDLAAEPALAGVIDQKGKEIYWLELDLAELPVSPFNWEAIPKTSEYPVAVDNSENPVLAVDNLAGGANPAEIGIDSETMKILENPTKSESSVNSEDSVLAESVTAAKSLENPVTQTGYIGNLVADHNGLLKSESEKVSALARYQIDFDYRLRLATRAAQAAPDSPTELMPVIQRECESCGWKPCCTAELDQDDISQRIVNGRFDFYEMQALRHLGIRTIAQLAKIDLANFLPQYLPLVTHRDGTEERLRIARKRAKMCLDGILIERKTTGKIPLPKAELEIDFDIETDANGRVYLWGFLIADGKTSPYYHEFSRFTDMSLAEEEALAEEAMKWLKGLVKGRDTLIYHYSAYERSHIRRLAKYQKSKALVWAHKKSELFFDLLPVAQEYFFGRDGLGLKILATAGAGFHWRDLDPSGLNSITWFDIAVHSADEAERLAHKQRILEYNEDDVRATYEVRKWLRNLS